MLEDQVLLDDPGMIHNDVFARNAVVRILGRKAVAEVVVVVYVVRKIRNMPKDALMGAELMIDSHIEAIIVIGSGGIGKIGRAHV